MVKKLKGPLRWDEIFLLYSCTALWFANATADSLGSAASLAINFQVSKMLVSNITTGQEPITPALVANFPEPANKLRTIRYTCYIILVPIAFSLLLAGGALARETKGSGDKGFLSLRC